MASRSHTLRFAFLFTLVAFVIPILALLLPVVNATAILQISPSSGPPGTAVSLTGIVDGPNSWLLLFESQSVASGVGDANGGVKASFNVPNNIAAGSHPVTLLDQTTQTQATTIFTVTETPPNVIILTVTETTAIVRTTATTITEYSIRNLTNAFTVNQSYTIHEPTTLTMLTNPSPASQWQQIFLIGIVAGVILGGATGWLMRRPKPSTSTIPTTTSLLTSLPTTDPSIPKTMTCDEMKNLLDNWLGKIGPLQDRLDWLSDVSKGYQEDVDRLRSEEEKLEEAIERVKAKVKELGDLLSKGGLGGTEYDRISNDYSYWLGALQHYRNDSIRLHGKVLDAQEFLDKWKKEMDDVHSKLDPLEKKRNNLNKKYVEECIKGKIEGPPLR